jgi:hypothetical protein
MMTSVMIGDFKPLPMFHYSEIEEKYSDYCDWHGVTAEVAKRHEALRHALAEVGGMLDVQQLQKSLSERGLLVSREQLRADIAFMMKTSR